MRNMGLEILEAAKGHGSAMAMRYQRNGSWQELSYREMARSIEAVAAGLVELGIRAGDRVGIFAPNMRQWLIADYAILSIRAVCVPIYATNSTEQAQVIIQDSGMRLLLCGTEDEVSKIRPHVDSCAKLESLAVLDENFNPADEQILHFSSLEQTKASAETSADIEQRRRSCDSSDLATIIYTSGTTGFPKGVQLSHGNFVNQHTSINSRFRVNPEDRSLCFLPLSHVYERSWSAYVFLQGACNTILQDPKEVITALAEVRPTVMVSAPRLYEKVYAAIMAKADTAPAIRKKLFAWALAVGEKFWKSSYADIKIPKSLNLKYKLADKLVLSKIRTLMGGPKNFLSSGGAPLDKSVEEFFLKLGLLICQGYGLTETAPMLTCNSPGEFKFGTVGKAIDGVEIRIASNGEIQVKGPNVTSGYFGMPEATAEAFREGWFCTGDIGHLDEEQYLVITDRLKDLIITSGGKNVAPQRIETMVGKDHFIDQLAVLGDKRKYISAIIVPAFENLREFAARKQLEFENHEELVKLPEVIEFYRTRIHELSTQLAPFEKIKRFTLVARQFTQQSGEITPTLKIRRAVIAQKYQQLIEKMYLGDEADAAITG